MKGGTAVKRLFGNKIFMVVAILVILFVGASALFAVFGPEGSSLHRVAASVVSPFQNLFTAGAERVSRLTAAVTKYEELEAENEALKAQIRDMEIEDSARQALADLAAVGYRNIRLEDVERVVQEAFSLEPNALKSSSRAKKNADPRAIAMWLARKHTRAALAEIGSYFGGRRHSAVLSAQKKVNGWLSENASVSSLDRPDLPVSEIINSLERSLTLSPR